MRSGSCRGRQWPPGSAENRRFVPSLGGGAGLIWWVLAVLAATSGPASPAHGEGRLALHLAPGPYLVGQGIPLTVDLPAAGGVPAGPVEAPPVAGADWFPLAATRGDRADFVLVPRRGGPLTIPPFRVRQGERSSRSGATTIGVGQVPATGRPPGWLGGVGRFTLTSQVEPPTVRLGRPVEYLIKLTGPASWGSERLPTLPTLPPAFEIRTTAVERPEVGSDGPARTFRYRLRAIKPGRVVIPPLAVAAFDPQSQRFQTHSAPSRVVMVEPPPGFDPGQVDFGPLRRPTALRSGRRAILAGLGLALAGTSIVVGWHRAAIRGWVERRRAGRPPDWRRVAAELAGWADRDRPGEAALAGAVVARLAEGIARATGRPVAVLTPPEAEAAIWGVTSDRQLARRAGGLVASCDRFRFDANADATVGDREELVAEAVAIFRTIGQFPPKIPPTRLNQPLD